MRKWQTIAVTALSTLALSGAGFTAYQMNQPSHYEGATFTNEKQSTSHSSSSNMASSTSNNESSPATVTVSSSDTTSSTQSSSVTEEQHQPLTFTAHEAKNAMGTIVNDENGKQMWLVSCEETGDHVTVKAEEVQAFCCWLTDVTEGKTTMNNSMQSNYNYWVQNVKGQQ